MIYESIFFVGFSDEFDLRLCGTTTDYNDLLGEFLLLQSHSFLHSYLVEGVHGVLDSVSDDAGLVWLDSDLHSIVDNSLTPDENSEGHGVFSEMMNSVILRKVRS